MLAEIIITLRNHKCLKLCSDDDPVIRPHPRFGVCFFHKNLAS